MDLGFAELHSLLDEHLSQIHFLLLSGQVHLHSLFEQKRSRGITDGIK